MHRKNWRQIHQTVNSDYLWGMSLCDKLSFLTYIVLL